MRKMVALALSFVLATLLVACGSAKFEVVTDETGIHAVATGGANGSGTGSITIPERFGLCVNHVVNKGSFHVTATDASGTVVFDKDITDNILDAVPVQGTIDVVINASGADGTIDVIAYDIAAHAEADDKLDAALEQVDKNREEMGLANPWSDAETAAAAAEGAGVGYLELPEEGTGLEAGSVSWTGYRYMVHLAEADGTLGTVSLTVRKGLIQESDDVSGDYNDYAHTWEVEAGDWKVTCSGNVEGKAEKVIWHSDNFSYGVNVRAEAGTDQVGLGEADVIALVGAIQ